MADPGSKESPETAHTKGAGSKGREDMAWGQNASGLLC